MAQNSNRTLRGTSPYFEFQTEALGLDGISGQSGYVRINPQRAAFQRLPRLEILQFKGGITTICLFLLFAFQILFRSPPKRLRLSDLQPASTSAASANENALGLKSALNDSIFNPIMT